MFQHQPKLNYSNEDIPEKILFTESIPLIRVEFLLRYRGVQPSLRINAEQIAYDIRNLNRSPEQRLLANLELLDLDEYEVEPLAIHWEALCALGIQFQSERVQMTINSYTRNLESAILYTLDVGERLRFDSPEHATNTFVKALREGW